MRQIGLPLFAKKAFDRAFALSALVATAPVLGAAAIAVRATLGSPVFFRQKRPGAAGVPFEIIKMRTMTDARDPEGRLLPDEARLTPFGRFLRSTSLDELPQLWNVLRGELSLVGPRPLLLQYLPLYDRHQARRHEVLPGITGWAQINGRNQLDWPDKFDLDVWYVDHWSLALDARILWQTVAAVATRRGVSGRTHATMANFEGNAPHAKAMN